MRQDDILPPLLFNFFLHFIRRIIDLIESGIELAGGRRLSDLDYADDRCGR